MFCCNLSLDLNISPLTNVWLVVSAGGAVWPAGDGGLQPAAATATAAADGAAGNPSVLQPPSADPSRPDPKPLPTASTTTTTGTNKHTYARQTMTQTMSYFLCGKKIGQDTQLYLSLKFPLCATSNNGSDYHNSINKIWINILVTHRYADVTYQM